MIALSPKGAVHASPGHRPGDKNAQQVQALKGRPNLCLNHSPGSTFTSSLARKIVMHLSWIRSANHCTATWRPFCKISAALRFSLTPSKITCISFSTLHEPLPSARPLKMLKSLRPNGSKHREQCFQHSRGNRVMALSRFPNRILKQFDVILQGSENITARKPSRKNTDNFWSDTASCSTNDMFGIRPPFQGSLFLLVGKMGVLTLGSRALPFATLGCPFGASDDRRNSVRGSQREKGALQAIQNQIQQQPSVESGLDKKKLQTPKAPKGRSTLAWGNAPGPKCPFRFLALKGRPKS
jgi:hypothetical protein